MVVGLSLGTRTAGIVQEVAWSARAQVEERERERETPLRSTHFNSGLPACILFFLLRLPAPPDTAARRAPRAAPTHTTPWHARAPPHHHPPMPLPHHQIHVLEPYTPPPWTAAWTGPRPPACYRLGALPTPVHRWRLPQVAGLLDLWVKRDDMSGSTLSGNKVRKLEFLFADALLGGGGGGEDPPNNQGGRPRPTIITVGGIQSNHARATAAAAAEAGLECHLILRAGEAVAGAADPGLAGNLLVDRLAGAHLHLVTKAEYAAVGGPGLTARLAARLVAERGTAACRPYIIPVGGSNAVGAWGYVQAVAELEAGVPPDEASSGGGGGDGAPPAPPVPWDDIVVACGSGGTVAGLAAGLAAAGLPARLHACGVCDDPAYFEAAVREEHLVPMGVPQAAAVAASVHYLQAKGAGYAISRPDEVATCAAAAVGTGILCDGTYVGKALHAFLGRVAADPGVWAGRRVLFLHTGGLLSMGAQTGGLEGVARALGRVERMVV